MIVLGAMSGTSSDGVDAAVLEMDEQGAPQRLLGFASKPFSSGFRSELLALQNISTVYPAGEDPFMRLLQARKTLTDVYAEVLNYLILETRLKKSEIAAMGVHGQTLRHRPDQAITYQFLDPARLAAQFGLPVVADLRSNDVALGGQGAPLVPTFHQAWLKSKGFKGACAVLNLGGFANLSWIDAKGDLVAGGDCGPANVLMDYWAETRFNRAFDQDGNIAKSGQLNSNLLDLLMDHPYLKRQYPKSTGRDDFTGPWLESRLKLLNSDVSDRDVMRTLLEMSVRGVVDSLEGQSIQSIFVCGGGANNSEFLKRLGVAMPTCRIGVFDELGLSAQAVESAAFAWFAGLRLLGMPASNPAVTGAHRAAMLGALYRID